MKFQELVEAELVRARAHRVGGAHAPMHSAHEGFAVLLEEVDELWEEVRKKTSERSNDRMLEELVQIAAMAQRFAEDVIGEEYLIA